MAKPKAARRASALATSEQLLSHLITLVVQADEQVGLLMLLADTRSSLEDPPAEPPKKYVPGTTDPEVQRAVLKQTMNDELRRQLKVLSRTIEAMYVCTDQVTGLPA